MSGFRGAYLIAPRAGSKRPMDKSERRSARLAARIAIRNSSARGKIIR